MFLDVLASFFIEQCSIQVAAFFAYEKLCLLLHFLIISNNMCRSYGYKAVFINLL